MIVCETIKVKIKEINSSIEEKRWFNRIFVRIKGVCVATTEDDIFEFDFDYTGRLNEAQQQIMDYLKDRAESILINNRLEKSSKENTLEDLVDVLSRYKVKIGRK